MTGWHSRNGINPARWAAVRRAAFRRDGWRCRQCGAFSRLEAHHAPPLHMRTDPRPYDLDGIVTYCRPCHIEFHRIERTGRSRKPEPEAAGRWRAFRDELRKETG